MSRVFLGGDTRPAITKCSTRRTNYPLDKTRLEPYPESVKTETELSVCGGVKYVTESAVTHTSVDRQ